MSDSAEPQRSADAPTELLVAWCRRWVEASQAGTPVAPEELCRERPDLLPELRQAIELLGAIEDTRAEPSHAGGELTRSHNGSAPGPVSGVTPAPTGPSVDIPAAGGQLGQYRLLGLLGAGGMGRVYLAEDTRLGRRVAVKTLRPDHAARPDAVERFLHEARAAAAVEHENVVPVYHVDEVPGVPYLVMPVLRGSSLESVLKPGGPLPPDEVARIGLGVARGLSAAHALGLIHRDIKPANVWLDGSDRKVRILDFGLARAADREYGLTADGAIVGTPAYMAPEQARGEPLDHRADLFSLGAVLYRCATGVPAFDGPTFTAVLFAVTNHNPPAAAAVNPTVPVALSDLIDRLLAKAPDGRPASAHAAADARGRSLGGTVPSDRRGETAPV